MNIKFILYGNLICLILGMHRETREIVIVPVCPPSDGNPSLMIIEFILYGNLIYLVLGMHPEARETMTVSDSPLINVVIPH